MHGLDNSVHMNQNPSSQHKWFHIAYAKPEKCQLRENKIVEQEKLHTSSPIVIASGKSP